MRVRSIEACLADRRLRPEAGVDPRRWRRWTAAEIRRDRCRRIAEALDEAAAALKEIP